MSILKFANGKNRGTRAIKEGVAYILNPQKTSSELIATNGVSICSPAQDMETVQALLNKAEGRRYIHFIISFDPETSAKKALAVATECAEYFSDDFQFVLAIHTNTSNIHAHVIMNAVNIHTGRKFSQSKREMLDFRDYVNMILQVHGCNVIGKTCEDDLINFELCDEDENYLDDMEDDENRKSFFGTVDPEEVEQIALAEEIEREYKKIIRFFEGDETELPAGWTYEDALDYYEKWSMEQSQYLGSCYEDRDSFFGL